MERGIRTLRGYSLKVRSLIVTIPVGYIVFVSYLMLVLILEHKLSILLIIIHVHSKTDLTYKVSVLYNNIELNQD